MVGTAKVRDNSRAAPIPGRQQTMERFREQGGRIAAVLPIHYPRALLRAHRILPVEIWGPAQAFTPLADSRLQSYICPLARNALDFLLREGARRVDMVLVPHTCDSLQGLGSLLLDQAHLDRPTLNFYLPRGAGDASVDYLAAEIRSLSAALSRISGRSPREEELIECVMLEEEADSLLSELLGARPRLPLPDHTFYRVVRSREYLPAEDFISSANGVLAGRTSLGAPERLPILLSGIVPEPMEIFDALAGFGAFAAACDLACASRRLYPGGKSGDPFRRMAESLLGAPPDFTRGSAIRDRVRYLRANADKSGARGVLFYPVKFCEPELFDLPLLRKGLDGAGLASTVIEAPLHPHLSQAARTRLEAFLEMLS
jgi:benzoyl-CoA reductase/2-hydroxyglutaryl-CoA dehydratase subunit BcrC/BadD/HgdB